MPIPAIFAAIGRLLAPRAASAALGRAGGSAGAKSLAQRSAAKRAGTGAAAEGVAKSAATTVRPPPAQPPAGQGVNPEVIVQHRGAPPIQAPPIQASPAAAVTRASQPPGRRPPVQPSASAAPAPGEPGGVSGAVSRLSGRIEQFARTAMRMPPAPGREGPSRGQGAPFSPAEALADQPRTFGDVMGGQKTLSAVQQQAEAGRQIGRQEEDQAASDAKAAEAKQEAWTWTKRTTLGLVGYYAALVKMPGITEKFGRAVLMSSESLRRYDGQINAAFARLHQADIRMGFAEARATGGSTSALSDALISLKDETQEIRHSLKTLLTLGTLGLVNLARLVNLAIELNPGLQVIIKILEKIEGDLNDEQRAGNIPVADFLNNMARGVFAGPADDRRRRRGGAP